MRNPQEQLKELLIFECPQCGGRGEKCKDSFAANQLGMPVGFSREAAARQREYAKQAYGPCSRCKGEGFILIPKSEWENGK